MQKLLFLDVEYHTKTGSCRFLRDLLADHFEVTVCQIDQYKDDPFCNMPDAAGQYDVLICWQIMPPRDLLDRYFQWNDAALFPMYDSSSEDGNPELWFPYRDFNIICFSKKLFGRLHRMGFSAQYIQYFPEPPPLPDWGDPQSVFFWARQESVNCRLVEELLQHTDIKKIHVHRAMDPEAEFVEPEQGGNIEYSFSTWFDDRRDMNACIHESAFYIAPRTKEGIGMSFLEAMAVGRCVIAPNDSTMNEYIEHGETGFLYEIDQPVQIQVSDVRAVQQQARAAIEEGYAGWQKEKKTIVRRVTTPVSVSQRRMMASIALRIFSRPQSVAKIIWKLMI